ncbi:hypothetical protein LTR70_010109 [Exophiala xenobiotica]|uniref:Uncharacterized protein n=1 Tax=Lithohypha guttulata TaxID=1690604 RepID=A0ABR0JVS1_9EURO|nr:hypothetical protein LTR24_010063 [Lithohypha guttulata]KAK5309642.1 hypothetical protein LTR70_010109 [Exophiala xenobiotica]
MPEAATIPRKENASIAMPAEILDMIASRVPHTIFVVTNRAWRASTTTKVIANVGAFDINETANAAARKHHVFKLEDMARKDLGYEDVGKLYASEPDAMGVADAELCGDDEKATLLNTQDKWGKEESMRKDGTLVFQTTLGWG